jgi:hypothetical protein
MVCARLGKTLPSPIGSLAKLDLSFRAAARLADAAQCVHRAAPLPAGAKRRRSCQLLARSQQVGTRADYYMHRHSARLCGHRLRRRSQVVLLMIHTTVLIHAYNMFGVLLVLFYWTGLIPTPVSPPPLTPPTGAALGSSGSVCCSFSSFPWPAARSWRIA